MDYHKIFSAHCRSRQALMLWGSSGYGKSSMVEEFARRYKLRLEVLHTQYLDPLALFIPATNEMSRQGFAKFYPSEIIHRILNSKEKTVLFLDELTRAREDTLLTTNKNRILKALLRNNYPAPLNRVWC
ncbi:MAG: AAA family ATPase [Proteobacteria bacterium]|nr:AAA family ATPase [Pseudomonadota bacterium]